MEKLIAKDPYWGEVSHIQDERIKCGEGVGSLAIFCGKRNANLKIELYMVPGPCYWCVLCFIEWYTKRNNPPGTKILNEIKNILRENPELGLEI